ncbi:hypothetical protein SAMN05421504_1132 [Amycolatopsis xylanica]|uniref:Extracellular repeat, HAF family n=1 Tax=Amycolatopsis xylanica TaxID=589385 RepID=A0A1H3S7W3_9PSEU|nr:hypothetical protein [Amycolatopsis xylanica]SDZ33847.1 hypothetical protein SAMN05421504_1132 [Amycolatopsis xylanica]
MLGKITVMSAAAVLVGTAVLSAPAAQAAGCTWAETTLATPPGYLVQSLDSGDGAGSIAGTVWDQTAYKSVGAIWQNGIATVLGAAFGQQTELADVNRAGVAVGFYYEGSLRHAVRSVNGAYERLPDPPGYRGSAAFGINDRGDIMGMVGTSDFLSRTVVWPADAPGTVKVLPVPLQRLDNVADIDEQGNVGASVYGTTPAVNWQGYVWPADGGPAVHLTPGSEDPVYLHAVRGGRAAGNDYQNGYVWNLDGTIARTLPGAQNVTVMDSAGAVVATFDDGSIKLLPADGGEAQVVAGPNTWDSLRVADITDDGDIYGLRSTESPYSTAVVKAQCR